jgi:hypothetical protein
MAITYLQLVNQKLAYARALLRALQPLGLPATAAQRLEQQSLIDAISFHLACAYRHYLRELAQNYGIKQAEGISTEAHLKTALAGQDKTAAEVLELQVLRQQPDSWMSLMHEHYESCWTLPSEPTQEVAVPESELIRVYDLDSRPEAVDYSLLIRWHDEFVALTGRQRETSAEY